MKVEMVVLAFPGKKAESYDTNDERINEITIENEKVKIDFMDQGRNWTREIPINKLKFIEYPSDALKTIKENVYAF
ncbi:hypothetical protein [Methanobacterium sp.]|uniref:hypothetical protein n=1 Tax=Methanobacterium sp. TaxID=2164 RepID=UPI003C7164DC